eukprot:maker-scaffold_4-snap-gene-7.1-mRNA-1 protein AED:0.27 eAED:0.27 QI:155/1/1/1/0.5/0.33/3/168/555
MSEDNTEVIRTPGDRRYAIFISVFASIGGFYFGYDQGVTGGMLTMFSFRDTFCVDSDFKNCSSDTDYPQSFQTFITLYNMLYYFGCMLGGLLGGVIGEKYGRKAAILGAALCFITGTAWVITTPTGRNGSALAGRVLEGIGVGFASFASPLYAAEVAPREYRGAMSGMQQMMVVTGLFASNVVNIFVEDIEHGWRWTNGVVLLAPAIIICGVWFLPESPRWLYQKKGDDGVLAKAALKKIRRTDDMETEFSGIGEQVAEEVGKKPATYADAFAKAVRWRLFLACMIQVCQQATGINPIFTYGGIIFAAVVDNEYFSLLVLSGVNLLSTAPAMYWLDRYGRRTSLLVGSVGATLGQLMVAVTFVTNCDEVTDENGDDTVECSGFAGEAMVGFCAVFVFFFAMSWGAVGWVYPPEIMPLHVRAKAVSLSSASNWISGTVMVGINQLFPLLGIGGVFFLFTCTCALCWVFAYFNIPETKGLMLEEIEALFTNKKDGDDSGSMDKKEVKSDENTLTVVEAKVEKEVAAEDAVKAVEEPKEEVKKENVAVDVEVPKKDEV